VAQDAGRAGHGRLGIADSLRHQSVFRTRSHTVRGTRRMAASLGNMGDGDNWRFHMYDTVKGSELARRPGRDRVYVPRGMPAVLELEHYGVPFSRTGEGKIYQSPSAGKPSAWQQMAQRTCATADRTGHASCTRCTSSA